MGRGGHASGYTPIKDATEMGSTHSSEGGGHGGGHGKHGHGGGKEGGVRGKFVSLACVFLAACFLAAIFDEPMSMKAEEMAVARGTATMVVEHGRTAGLRSRKPEAVPRAAASQAASTRPVSGMVLSEGQAPPEGPHSFRFRVPHNAAPGSIMHIMVPGGKELHDVKIPENAKPGDMMFLTLPSGEGAEAAAKEGGGSEGEEGKEEEGEGEGEEEENPLTAQEMRALIGEDVNEVPEEVEELTTFKGQKEFWRHWFLCVITFFIGAMLVGYAVRGVLHGFGPIDVDPRKLPDHPGRFNDAKLAELAMGHMDMYGDEPQVSVSARGSSNIKSPRDSRSPAQSPRVTAEKPGSKFPDATPKDAELDGGDAEDDDRVSYRTILEEARSEEMWLEVWNRGKWLLVLLIFQSTSSIVLASFEELIKHHLALTLFLTMLVGAGGNAGAQSVVKDISLIAAGHTPGSKREWQRALIRTGIMAIALAIGLGMAGYVRVFFFQGTGQEALAIAISCGVIVFSGIVVGTALPFAMIWCGFDPLHAGAVIQVLMDIWGVIVSCLVCQAILGDASGTPPAA